MDACMTCGHEYDGTPCLCRVELDADAMAVPPFTPGPAWERRHGDYSQRAHEDGMRLWRDLRSIEAIDTYLSAVRDAAAVASRRDVAQDAREGGL